MPARNDKAAVAKAAKAVSRKDVVALLKQALVKPRRSPPKPPEPARYGGSSTTPSVGGLGGGVGSPFRGRRRASPRRGRQDSRKVIAGWSTRYGKGGSKRYRKARYVRDRIAKAEAGERTLRVYQLVGAFYDPETLDKLSLHDLDVMVEKGIIKLEGEIL